MNDHEKTIEHYLTNKKINKFSVVFCFSITMWIHLNFGDNGLKSFLTKICKLGKIIIIEPQPWKCYRNAVKRMKTTNFHFPLFSQLKIRGNVEEEIETFLTQNCQTKKIFESGTSTKWGRKILIFKSI